MARSTTTGLYTRVDNSFSNPVVGTTISPTDADTFFDDVESSMNSFIATSASSVAIGTGAKTFTVASDVAGKAFLAGTFVHVWSRADVADYMFGSVTSYSTSTGALVLDVVATGGSGTNTDWNIQQAGARGATGATGSTGPTGGVKYNYSTTTTDSDPGAGIFRLNHATVASATEGYFDNVDSDGNTVTTWLDSFDDSTTTAKGVVILNGITTPTALAIFNVTGSVVDGTGYRKLTFTYVSGGGTFTNGESFAVNFIRTGDKGADGAGAGDVTAASSFGTDNVVVKSDGTGKGVQATGIAVDDSNNVSSVGTLGCGAITSTGALSIGTSNAATVGSVELGHASDTTITRVSAGLAAVEGATIATISTAQTWTAKQTFTSPIELKNAIERWNIVADNLASGDNNIDYLTNNAHYYTTAGDTNAVLNFRGDGSNSLDSVMDTGDSITFAIMLTHTGTAYYITGIKVDGSSVTPQWLGDAAPTAGTVNKRDVYTYTIIKTGSATFIAEATFAAGN